jgi:hypothetical protein
MGGPSVLPIDNPYIQIKKKKTLDPKPQNGTRF